MYIPRPRRPKSEFRVTDVPATADAMQCLLQNMADDSFFLDTMSMGSINGAFAAPTMLVFLQEKNVLPPADGDGDSDLSVVPFCGKSG